MDVKLSRKHKNELESIQESANFHQGLPILNKVKWLLYYYYGYDMLLSLYRPIITISLCLISVDVRTTACHMDDVIR